MGKTAETSLWDWLGKARRGLELLQMERVENALGRSHPDVDGCWMGGAFKIELKTAARPARPTTPVRFKFQPGQSRWLRRRWQCGGAAWLLLQVGSGHDAARYLVPGEMADRVEAGATEADLMFWSWVPGSQTAAETVSVAGHGR
jgi:hypothetical protein